MRFFLLFILLFFSACSFKPKAIVDESKTYVLKDDNKDFNTSFVKVDKILKISSPSLPLYLEGKNIIYIDNLKSNSYSLNFFEDSIKNLYIFTLLSKFERANIFSALANEDSNFLSDYMLDSRIDSFEQILDKNNNYILIKISVDLIDLNKNKLIKHRYFVIKKDVKSQIPSDVIKTFDEALNNISDEIILWVNDNFKKE